MPWHVRVSRGAPPPARRVLVGRFIFTPVDATARVAAAERSGRKPRFIYELKGEASTFRLSRVISASSVVAQRTQSTCIIEVRISFARYSSGYLLDSWRFAVAEVAQNTSKRNAESTIG